MRQEHMPHFRVDQAVQELPFNHCATANASPDGEVQESGEPLRCAPARLTQGGTIHVGIKANGKPKRSLQTSDDIGAAPAGLGGCEDVPISGGGRGWVERSKASDTQATQLAQGSALLLEKLNCTSQCLIWGGGRKASFYQNLSISFAHCTNKFSAPTFDCSK